MLRSRRHFKCVAITYRIRAPSEMDQLWEATCLEKPEKCEDLWPRCLSLSRGPSLARPRMNGHTAGLERADPCFSRWTSTPTRDIRKNRSP